ncbi:MAG: HlyD family type I secretion periplasmic adaptor subunit [Elusimicrobiota bacterium]|jgi:HlyD family type I secretion membrane fusion protein|nr:HlyD family type I secretion periplasmic adaptor subunit [Elusimicrobiota bacterium]
MQEIGNKKKNCLPKIRHSISKILDFLSDEPIKVGIFLLYVFLLLVFIWGYFAKLESASVSSGTVVLDANQKIIQHLEGGIIENIFVKEGDFVEEGQELMALSMISAKSNIKILYGEIISQKANEIRLFAEKEENETLELEKKISNSNYYNLLKKYLQENENFTNISNENNDYDYFYQYQEIIKTQENLFNSRKNDLKNKIDIYKNQIEQLKEEIKGLEIQKTSYQNQLILLQEEANLVESLVQEGHETQIRLYALKRNIEELSGNIGNLVASISKAKQAINRCKLDIIDLKNERENEILRELKETQVKINDLDARIMNAEDVFNRIIIKTAYSGIVSDMKFYTIGGVVPPHTDIMTIIPQNDDLIIESKLNPQDIDVVHIGLKAKVNLSAYKSRYIPALFGEVIYVAPDKITDPATKMSYYIIKIKIDESDEKNKKIIQDKNIKLHPGMPAEVFVITGSRTFLQYLTDPLLKSLRRGFREE